MLKYKFTWKHLFLTCTFVLALKKVYMVEPFLHESIDFEWSLLSIEYFSHTNITFVKRINLVNEVFHVNGYKNTKFCF
jgi:hypothetical protein